MTYRSFTEAKRFARSLGLRTLKEWSEFCKSGKIPTDIPRAPWHIYRETWKGIGDWLGTGNIAPSNMKFRPFDEAKKCVRSLNFKDYGEWKQYCKSGRKPRDIPSNPEKTYAKYWKGIGDWLGTGSVATFNQHFRLTRVRRQRGCKCITEWMIYWLGHIKFSGLQP